MSAAVETKPRAAIDARIAEGLDTDYDLYKVINKIHIESSCRGLVEVLHKELISGIRGVWAIAEIREGCRASLKGVAWDSIASN